jgi:arginine exporter protein ArgO
MRTFSAIHAIMALLFVCAALTLIFLASHMGWTALTRGDPGAAAQQIIEAIGLLAAAVVALQIAQTIAEEEVVRAAHVSGPTRVRRFLSRFMVVLVVALAIEGLVATFRALHENPAQLPFAASVVFATGALLAGWGLFIRLNTSAEALEPEAMEEAKREDKKLK